VSRYLFVVCGPAADSAEDWASAPAAMDSLPATAGLEHAKPFSSKELIMSTDKQPEVNP
jgi:hypothetical protein